MSLTLAIPPPEADVVPGSQIIYGVAPHGKFIGFVYQTTNGHWHAVPSIGAPSSHSGPLARWDASHALTLAHMKTLE